MKRRQFILGSASAAAAARAAPAPLSPTSVPAIPRSDEAVVARVLPAGRISPKSGIKAKLVHNLVTPMRDGTQLAMDLIRPEAPGAYPVVLIRTPYGKVDTRSAYFESLAERGYIVAIQDTRGRFNSDGVFFPFRDDRADGYDTVEWIARQDWCNGNVGMEGGSYVGQTQWFAAMDAPPHLKSIIPRCSPPDAFLNEPICNGCFLLPDIEWMQWMGLRSFQFPESYEVYDEPKPYYSALPLASAAQMAGCRSKWWDEWMDHPTFDDFWRGSSYQHAWPQMQVATLNVTGWWDMNFPGAPQNFAGLRRYGRTSQVRRSQQLIIGPWPHRVNRMRSLNGVDFGDQAIVNLDDYRVRFHDRWLKGVQNGIESDSRVHVFVIGANEWRAGNEWPPAGTKMTPFYLHSRGSANGSEGDGVLSLARPGREPADAYRYDPADPIGLFWNMRDGPVDDSVVSRRKDMLCYTTAALASPLEVVGPVRCVLYASSSALDTDWHVRLVNVHPGGEARFLCHGMLRARFRESLQHPVLLKPDAVYPFELDMDACGVRFLAGHRIRIEIMSSWFPEYDRNTNSGAWNNFRDERLVVAHNRVFHDSRRASCVLLPLPGES